MTRSLRGPFCYPHTRICFIIHLVESPIRNDQLNTPVAPVKKKRNRLLKAFVWSLTGAVVALGVAYGANSLYLYLNYNQHFYVNGMSMYPTINLNGTRKSAEGTHPLYWDDGSSLNGDQIDYGLGKTIKKEDVISSIARNDIVITYYPRDYETDGSGEYRRDSGGNLILKQTATIKIKRVVALPKERMEYRLVAPSEDESDTLSPIYGQTKIINDENPNGFYLKPLYKASSFAATPSSSVYPYPYHTYAWAKEAKEYNLDLGQDEYIVAGDNRGCSSDSLSDRFVVKAEMIIGKAYLLVGRCEFISSSSGNHVNIDYSYTFMPWNYRELH